MTGFEKIAAINIKKCFNYEIGSLYNAFLDGETNFPTIEEVKNMIYTLSIHNKYIKSDCIIGRAPKEIKFAGKDFCLRYIDYLFENDDDASEIPWKESK